MFYEEIISTLDLESITNYSKYLQMRHCILKIKDTVENVILDYMKLQKNNKNNKKYLQSAETFF